MQNNMNPYTIDTITLSYRVYLQSDIRYFSLAIGKILRLQWQDVEICKGHINIISKINFIFKK